MEAINIEKSSQGCWKAMQIGFCDSHCNTIMDIQNGLSHSEVAYPATTVLFSSLMEVNHVVRNGRNYPKSNRIVKVVPEIHVSW